MALCCPRLGVFNYLTVVSNDWLLYPIVARLLADVGKPGASRKRWGSRQTGVPNQEGVDHCEAQGRQDSSVPGRLIMAKLKVTIKPGMSP
ncbi:uncharacterized protein G2W53_003907 [Senna tora]|uniref:Uncharacterized protein n=1 Tax=Senna tora TaxID=362788 RepID=A0A834XC97_9FABA|nr:uncharacterized protein G2W53_003907 [Senna tora]